MTGKIPFLGAEYDDVTFDEVCGVVRKHVASRLPGYMMSLNVDILVKADKDPAFMRALKDADLILMDSTPLMKAAKKLGLPIREKLAGSDLMPRICGVAANNSWSCFILGGSPGIPELAAKQLEKLFPGLKIAGTLSPAYGFEKDPDETASVLEAVRKISPDILFVCLGEPKAGLFVAENLDRLGISFAFNVGAAVDFAAGSVPRAPKWMQAAGLEWFYRFIREPKRLFKRYFVESWRMISIVRKTSSDR